VAAAPESASAGPPDADTLRKNARKLKKKLRQAEELEESLRAQGREPTADERAKIEGRADCAAELQQLEEQLAKLGIAGGD
jgi:hypothetical protein